MWEPSIDPFLSFCRLAACNQVLVEQPFSPSVISLINKVEVSHAVYDFLS